MKVTGRFRLGIEDARLNILRPVTDWHENTLTIDANAMLTRLVIDHPLRKSYSIEYLYLEFVNSASPIEPIVVNPNEGISYYIGLASDPDLDFIRVPIHAYSSNNEKLLVVGSAESGMGVHGLTFDSANSSRVIGVAAVAARNPGDYTQDLVWSRGYFSEAQQLLLPQNHPISVEWSYTPSIV